MYTCNNFIQHRHLTRPAVRGHYMLDKPAAAALVMFCIPTI